MKLFVPIQFFHLIKGVHAYITLEINVCVCMDLYQMSFQWSCICINFIAIRYYTAIFFLGENNEFRSSRSRSRSWDIISACGCLSIHSITPGRIGWIGKVLDSGGLFQLLDQGTPGWTPGITEGFNLVLNLKLKLRFKNFKY